jgi:hypothetical protein
MQNPSDDTKRIRRIAELISAYRQQQTPIARFLTRDEYLKYYLSPADWVFWQQVKDEQLKGL